MQTYADIFRRKVHRRAKSIARSTGVATIGLLFLLSFGCSPDKPTAAVTTNAPVPARPVPPPRPSWSHFRGNSALTGVSGDKLPEKPAMLWSFKTGGAVKSSAVIGDDRIFIGSDDGNIYALNYADGKQLWAFKADSGVEAPPLLAGNSVYAGSMEGFFYALDAKAGGLLWKVQTDGKITASANALARSSGPQRVVFGSYDFKLRCLDGEKGTTNWVFESGNYINGSCAVSEGRVIFGGCDSMVHMLAAEDGKEISQTDAGAYIGASVAVAGNRAYVGHYDNEFLCIDLVHTNVVWRYRDQEFPFMSAAAVTENRVVFGGQDKTLHCVNRDDGKSVWSFPSQGKIDGSPVVAGDKVVFGSADGRVYLVSMAEGKELWSYDTGQPIASSPAVAGNRIVIGCDDGNVYCFGEKAL
jgi:outer membrane protein assembly factor BamB